MTYNKDKNWCYQGEWKDGKRDGHGTECYGPKSIYVGSFVKDNRHGYGKFCNSGFVMEGYWKLDKLHG